MNKLFEKGAKLLGIERNTTTHSEKCLSAMGALISMMGCYWITLYSLPPNSGPVFVASMAASAILLFAIPHGALSQPWPLVMGHMVSASIGIIFYDCFGNSMISASLAVGLSVFIMYYLGCLHPPGGATAYFVVTAGQDVHALGFDFLWLIILANVVCLLVLAILFNLFFHWRRYPAYLFQKSNDQVSSALQLTFTQEDVAAALHEINSFIDVTPEDLTNIFEHALQHAQKHHQKITKIEAGKFYSNGLLGKDWQVYKVISCEKGKVSTYTVAGKNNSNEKRTWRLNHFKRVIQQEVYSQGQHWVRSNSIIANA